MSLIKELIANIKRAKELEAFPLAKHSNTIVDFRKSKQAAIVESINSLLDKIEKLNPDAAQIITKIRNSEDFDSMLSLANKIPFFEQKTSGLKVPSLISGEVNADWLEAQKCFENSLFRSCVILCGRILEAALHAKYFLATGVDLLEKAPGIGLGNLIAKLSEKGVIVDPGLSNQIHLINQVRVSSVHKKKNVFVPSGNQAQAIMLFTRDAVEKLFIK
ncbi:hypothetical protein DRJ22_04445 [Candidatus Woesearchaeota archaeon]|nr:MAG: hypothetical protein DRJ22_04445 [Candidatus Woesearchaeota archaeon]